MESHEVLFLTVLSFIVTWSLLLCSCFFGAVLRDWCKDSRKDKLPRVSRDEGTLNHKGKRGKSRKRKKISSSVSWSTRESEPPSFLPHSGKHISVKNINTPKGPRTVIVERKMPSFPCHKCQERTAKKGCRFCASCCRNFTNSVCGVHGTGFDASQERVYQACREQAYELDLSFSHLSRYPKCIPEVGNQLELLNLSTNRLPNLPEDIGALVGVRECYLQYNCLMGIPDSICCLTNLQELDIKNNRLKSLPKEIGNLKLLRTLAVSNNNLQALPSSIGQLLSLEEFNLHQNELVSLPDEICQLNNLEYLYLGKNPLQVLPKDFGRLDSLLELDLSDCELRSLPDSICHCQALDKLWLNNNNLHSLPNRIGDLSNLKEFHVRSNCLKYLPATMLNMSLYTFTAHDNCFLHEFDRNKISKYCDSPCSIVPSLQEVVARAIIDFEMVWEIGLLPNHLEKYLSQPSFCTRCGGPFFRHFWRKLTFGIVVVTRVPLLHEECSQNCDGYDKTGCSDQTDPLLLW